MKFLSVILIISAFSLAYAGGDGKNLFYSKCAQCHSTSVALKVKQDKKGWMNTIKKMEKFGLEANNSDEGQIADFLAGQK